MRIRLHMLLPMVLVLSLGACGGGGDAGGGSGSGGSGARPPTSAPPTQAPAAPPATADADFQRYLGEWLRCFPVEPNSVLERLVIHQVDTASPTVVNVTSLTSGPDCTGAVQSTATDYKMLSPIGEKTIGTETVRKITMTEPGVEYVVKQVMVLRADGKLYFGKWNALLDAEGYPETLLSIGFTRQ